MKEKQIITHLENVDAFFSLLHSNSSLILLHFGATWCKPCRQCAPVIEAFFANTPPNIICLDLDVDENTAIYSFLKSKRMVNGIPTILCYKKGNTHWIPDDSIVGADFKQLDQFFQRCGHLWKTIPPSI